MRSHEDLMWKSSLGHILCVRLKKLHATMFTSLHSFLHWKYEKLNFNPD